MTSVLLFTDFHASSGFSEFSKSDEVYKNNRFRIQCECLEYILNQAEKLNLPVIFGGDLFHTRQKVPVFDFNKIYSIFANTTVPIYLLRGNHDSINNLMGSESSIDTFKFLPNITVISEPEVIRINDLNLYFMPYGEDTKAIKEKLKEFAEDSVNYSNTLLVSHLGIQGATINGTVSDSPLMTGDFYPNSFNFIYMGHYHKRQKLGNLNNFIYGGSTIQNSFSDSGESKGYDILDFENSKVTDTFYPLDTPKFITVDKWDDYAKQEIDSGNYVRVRIPADQVETIKNSDVDQTLVRTEPIKSFELNSRIGITTEDAPIDIVSKYLSSKQLDEYLPLAKKVLETL